MRVVKVDINTFADYAQVFEVGKPTEPTFRLCGSSVAFRDMPTAWLVSARLGPGST